MTIETWAKALTALEAGVEVFFFEDHLAWYATDGKRNELLPKVANENVDNLVIACDALSLPWQQHPVWRMWGALQMAGEWLASEYRFEDFPEPAHEGMCHPDAGCDAICMERYHMAMHNEAARRVKAVLDAAKGGG